MNHPLAARQRLSQWPSWEPPLPVPLSIASLEACPYLEGRSMRVRCFLSGSVPGGVYQKLLDAGFRRSGSLYYQPACDGCRECVPLRIPVGRFAPTPSQRRTLRRNGDLKVEVGGPAFTPEKEALYERYLAARHGRKGVDEPADGYADLATSSTESLELRFRLGDRLVALSLADRTPRALSSVYAIFDPDLGSRSLGTFTVLAEIDLARSLGLEYYYLGYWVKDSRKMSYKARFRPAQVLGGDSVWRDLDGPDASSSGDGTG